jgi:hypothetical protein
VGVYLRYVSKLNTFTALLATRPAICAQLEVRTVDGDRQYVLIERSVQRTETGSICRIRGPYSGPRPAVCAQLEVRMVDGDRKYVLI